jgi:hypothetical protein
LNSCPERLSLILWIQPDAHVSSDAEAGSVPSHERRFRVIKRLILFSVVGYAAFFALTGTVEAQIQCDPAECPGGSSHPCYQGRSSCPPGQPGCKCTCYGGYSSGYTSCSDGTFGPCLYGNTCGIGVLIGPDLKPVVVAASRICPSSESMKAAFTRGIDGALPRGLVVRE